MFQKIKHKILVFRKKSATAKRIYGFFRDIAIHVLAIIPDKLYAKVFYKIYTGKKLNLKNPTITNEKMWWLKLYNRDPLMTVCSDKHLAREYVAEKGYSDILIPQVACYQRAKDIDFSKFTKPVVLKTNNGSGDLIFYTPGDPEFNEKSVRKHFKKSLKQKYHLISREWNYKNIPPRVVVEEVIKDPSGEALKDFRFFCFDGEPRLLMMDVGVFRADGKYQVGYPRNMYDMDFNLLPIRWGRDRYEGTVEKPQNFERMKEIASKLSEPFPMCRVDLYNVDGKIYFGEVTFYHGGCCQNIEPEEWDKQIAGWINLESNKIVKRK